MIIRGKKYQFKWQNLSVLFFCVLFLSCQKPEEHRCFKGSGDPDSLEIPLDTVYKFNLYKNLKYRVYQDNQRKVVVKGGKNVIGWVEVLSTDNIVSISNKNRCNFFRQIEDIIEVEIHYPYLKDFYVEPSDSIIFMNTIVADTFLLEIREGGGSAKLDTEVDFLRVNVSHGTGDYTLSGHANNAEVKIQNNGFADALNFNTPNIFLFHNSTSFLKINLENTKGIIQIEGTGDVEYKGTPLSPQVEIKGSGKFRQI